MPDHPNFADITELFGLQPVEDSEADLDDAPDDGPDKETLLEKGNRLVLEGKYEKAIEILRMAVDESGGTSPEALLSLASVLELTDLAPQALRQYRKALKISSDDPDPHLSISDIYRRHGKGQEALKELEAAIAANPDNAYYHYRLAETLKSLGHPKKAYSIIQRSILLDPEKAFYHYWAANVLIQLRQYDEAVDALRAAVELSPGDEHLYVRTAVAFWGAGRHLDAIKAARLASDLSPDDLSLYALQEAFLRASGMPEEADLLKDKTKMMTEFDREVVERLLHDANFEQSRV